MTVLTDAHLCAIIDPTGTTVLSVSKMLSDGSCDDSHVHLPNVHEQIVSLGPTQREEIALLILGSIPAETLFELIAKAISAGAVSEPEENSSVE